ncbi:MAG: 4,5-DOPA dioxygenase extradiol [Chitinophagales bacterium]
MSTLSSLKTFADNLKEQDGKMPLLFVGHGSPMNGIEDNEFSRRWKQMGKEIPQPKTVLCISAHWLTNGTAVTAMEHPQTIHDFGGFPKELFDVQYPAPGNPELANETATMIHKTKVGLDHDWGLDHGTWSVVRQMYPEAKIPVLQLSIDYYKPAQYHYDLAKEISELRKKGVLIIGSGNMVHNLRMIEWNKNPDDAYGYDWAIEMNEKFKNAILNDDHQSLINYQNFGAAGKNAIPTPDHYYPLMYVLGLKEKNESVSFFNDKAVMGSLTMTSVKIDS